MKKEEVKFIVQDEKPFKERVKNLIHDHNDYVTEYVASLIGKDNKAHITLDLRHGNPIFETYSSGRDLSSSIFEYISNVAKYVPVTIPVSIDFIINPAEVPLENFIKRDVLTNYRFDFDDKRKQAKLTKAKGFAMMGIGVVFLLAYIVLVYFFNMNPDNLLLSILSNVISIVSWVFIWDAVDKWSFEQREYQKEALKVAQLCTADVNFIVEKDAIIVPSKRS
jgi:hypothetical protein